MKYLILLLIFTNLSAAEDRPEILSEQELKSKFVSSIQGTIVEDQLINSSEFKDCAEKNKFDPKKTRDQQYMDKTTADAVQQCFIDKLSKKKPEQLKELSKNLNLNGYQLIRSQNVQEITSTLSNRLYKKMTGIDLEAKNVKDLLKSMSLKNPNRKIVDQKDFAELYRIQLGKSALYEISRFCFTNLRRTGSGNSNTFKEHWVPGGNGDPGTVLTSLIGNGPEADVTKLTDEGNPEFGDLSSAGADKEKIYDSIRKSFSQSGNFSADETKDFFTSCMKTITPLCKEFRSKTKTLDDSLSQASANAQAGSSSATSGTLSKGSTACLVQDRLQRIRAAMADTSKVLGQFDELAGSSSTIELKESITRYNSRDQETGFNAVSTMTSDDFLVETKNNQDKQDACAQQGADTEECKGFLIQDDSFKKAVHDTDMNLRLRSQIEIETIKKLNGMDLEKYLKEKGYLELLEASKNQATFEEEVKKFFDAQRLASIEAIKNKVGKRQVDKDETDNKVIEAAVQESAKTSKEEKARLAQVVLFTNIVTSNLVLKKKDGNETKVIGRNNLGLSREKSANAQYAQEFFQNIQASDDDGSTNAGTEDYLSDIEFLDQVIGGK